MCQLHACERIRTTAAAVRSRSSTIGVNQCVDRRCRTQIHASHCTGCRSTCNIAILNCIHYTLTHTWHICLIKISRTNQATTRQSEACGQNLQNITCVRCATLPVVHMSHMCMCEVSIVHTAQSVQDLEPCTGR